MDVFDYIRKAEEAIGKQELNTACHYYKSAIRVLLRQENGMISDSGSDTEISWSCEMQQKTPIHNSKWLALYASQQLHSKT